jgi:hypothetical protein
VIILLHSLHRDLIVVLTIVRLSLGASTPLLEHGLVTNLLAIGQVTIFVVDRATLVTAHGVTGLSMFRTAYPCLSIVDTALFTAH